MAETDRPRRIDDPAYLAEAAQLWRRIRARRLAREAEQTETETAA